MAVYEPKGIVASETDKSIFRDGSSYRIWLDKKTMTVRIKFYDLGTVHYVEKGSKLYNDLLRDFFGIVTEIDEAEAQ
ncbi:uncharacterized protein YacL (UPF0231 family) [Peribacillus sp. B2I2]|uniref:hypothetical protein n=1 Tax=Peribacillus sp. B2I2 TaxID=3156468 RepID=UPI0035161B1E